MKFFYIVIVLLFFLSCESKSTENYSKFIFTSIPDTISFVNKEYLYNVNTSDDSENHAFFLDTKPDWLKLNTNGAVTTLKGLPEIKDIGHHNIVLRAQNGKESIYQQFSVKVINNHLPVVESKLDTTIYDNIEFNYQFPISDLDEDPLYLTVKNLPTWLTYDSLTYKINGTPSFTDAGLNLINIELTDLIDTVTFNINIEVSKTSLTYKVHEGNGYSSKGIDIIENQGGYLILGQINSLGNENSEVWLLQVDEVGNKLWEKFYGENDSYKAFKLEETFDGNIIIFGNIKPDDSSLYDGWALKLDKNGNVLNETIFGSVNFDMVLSVKKISSGDFLLVGSSKQFATQPNKAWLVRFNKNGNMDGEKYFNIDKNFRAIDEVTPNEYILASDSLFLRLNENYDITWSVNNGSKPDSYGRIRYPHDIFAIDNGFLSIQFFYAWQNDNSRATKYDNLGVKLSFVEYTSNTVKTKNGFISGGVSFYHHAPEIRGFTYFSRLSLSGDLIWRKRKSYINGPDHSIAYSRKVISAIETNDGYFVISNLESHSYTDNIRASKLLIFKSTFEGGNSVYND